MKILHVMHPYCDAQFFCELVKDVTKGAIITVAPSTLVGECFTGLTIREDVLSSIKNFDPSDFCIDASYSMRPRPGDGNPGARRAPLLRERIGVDWDIPQGFVEVVQEFRDGRLAIHGTAGDLHVVTFISDLDDRMFDCFGVIRLYTFEDRPKDFVISLAKYSSGMFDEDYFNKCQACIQKMEDKYGNHPRVFIVR